MSFFFRYDRRCGIKYDIVYDSVNEKACTRTYEEKCDGKNHLVLVWLQSTATAKLDL